MYQGYKRPATEYNNKSSHTTLKVMQWNAIGLMRKKTEPGTQNEQKRILIYAVYKKLIYKRIRHYRLEDINASKRIEEETGGRVVL